MEFMKTTKEEGYQLLSLATPSIIANMLEARYYYIISSSFFLFLLFIILMYE